MIYCDKVLTEWKGKHLPPTHGVAGTLKFGSIYVFAGLLATSHYINWSGAPVFKRYLKY